MVMQVLENFAGQEGGLPPHFGSRLAGAGPLPNLRAFQLELYTPNHCLALTDVSILLGVSTKLSRHNSNVSKVHSSLR